MVIAWNDRRMEEAPFTRAYEAILERFGIDYKNVKDSYPEADRIQGFLSTFTQRDLPNHQILDWDSLRGRLRSSSFTPAEGHPNFAPMIDELRKLFDAHQQKRSGPHGLLHPRLLRPVGRTAHENRLQLAQRLRRREGHSRRTRLAPGALRHEHRLASKMARTVP